VEGDDALQFIREMRAPFGLAFGECLLLAIIGVRQMIDAGEQRAEMFAVIDDAADGNAAEARAVIAALAADQAGAPALAAHGMISERDLERGIDRLRAGIAEKDMIEIAGRKGRDARGERESLRMRELKGRGVIEFTRRALDRGDDGIAIVADIAAPHAGGAVEHGAAVGLIIMHVLGAHDEARILLEGPIGGEGHPEGFEIVRRERVEVSRFGPGARHVLRLRKIRPHPIRPKTLHNGGH
jgi:hypothetical protein